MIALLIGSDKDASLCLKLQKELEEIGCAATSFYPELGGDATLPAHALRIMQGADYFIYLVTQYSETASYLKMLTPETVAPICAAGVQVVLLVANDGSLPDGLGFLPCLYLLDEETLPVMVEGLVQTLGWVDAIQPTDLYHLRYGARDLEAFFETAQSVSITYSGLEAAWDGMQTHDEATVKEIFDRLSGNVSFGANYASRLRLEHHTEQQNGRQNIILKILEDYKQLERDWHSVSMNFTCNDMVRANILMARCRVAVFIHLLYLIMALKLQPYCDHYMHMQGLKLKQDMHYTPGVPQDPAMERLSFLMASTKKNPM